MYISETWLAEERSSYFKLRFSCLPVSKNTCVDGLVHYYNIKYYV